jgi:hypothetical protein
LEYIPDEVFKIAGAEWDRLLSMYHKAIDRFNDALEPCLEMDYRDVPDGPVKGWVCRYLRLLRGDKKDEANLVAHIYAISRIKAAPDAPEIKIKSVQRDDDEEGGM